MPVHLLPHPDSSFHPDLSIEVDFERGASGLFRLRYLVRGPVEGISFPAPAAPDRVDGLWQHTCFEAFLRPVGGDAYYEFNFSPSGEWAAYRFDDYRTTMRNADVGAPETEARLEGEAFELRAALHLPGDGPWQLGLSAVIEERGGGKSYWAVAHPPGKADFHHPACFAVQVPPAVAP